MLTSIRENISGWIAWLIVILISIPFALWGVNSYFEAQSTVVVAKGDGVKITDRQLKSALDRQAEIIRSQFGPKAAAQTVEKPAFRQQVLDSLIERQLLREDIADNGFRLSDAQLNAAIQGTPDFQVNGKFSAEKYARLVSTNRSSPAQYENSIRAEQAMQQAAAGYEKSAIVVPSRLNQLLALKGQQRDMQYALFEPSLYRDSVQISEQQVRQQYDASKESYRSPEMVSVDYVVLSIPELAKTIQPAEEKLREYYEENKDQFRSEEQRKASHILVAASGDDEAAWNKAKEKAAQLAEQARQGGDFSALASENSDDPGSAKKGGDLGFFGKGAMAPEFEKKVFSMQQGEISEPVKTPFGYHVIKLEEIRPEAVKSFDQVREKILQAVRKEQAENQFYELAEVLNNTVYEQPDSLEPAAEAINAKVKTSELFDRNGGKGLFSNPKIVDAAFSEQVLNEGINSDTVEADNETLVALRIKKRQQSVIQPYEAVKQQIRQQLITEAAAGMAKEKAAAMVKSLLAGADWSGLVQQNGVQSKQEPALTRDKDLGFGGKLTASVFRMPAPASGKPSAQSIDLADKGQAVVKLNQVTDADPAKAAEADVARIKSVLQSRFGAEFFTAYRKALRQNADIELNIPE